jgi:hypothetical protein
LNGPGTKRPGTKSQEQRAGKKRPGTKSQERSGQEQFFVLAFGLAQGFSPAKKSSNYKGL